MKVQLTPKSALFVFFFLKIAFIFTIWFTFSCLFYYFIFYFPGLLLSRSI